MNIIQLRLYFSSSNTKTAIIGFLGLLFLPIMVMAQNTGTVSGTVTDAESGDPLAGANVLIEEDAGTSTDADGQYSLELDPGDYMLRVSYVGYASKSETISIESGESQTVDFALEADLVGSDEVVIIGSRRQGRTVTESPVPVDVISLDDIEETGFSQTTQVIRALVPSFNSPESSITDGTDHVRPATLRGLGPDQTLVLVNGKRRHSSAMLHVNGSVGRGSTGVDLNAIPSNMIESIEVLRDGAAAQYGSDAIAGVMNLNLKDNTGLDASFSYGQHLSQEERGYDRNEALAEGQSPADFLDSPYYPGKEDVWRTDGNTVDMHLGYGFDLPNDGNLYISGQFRDQGYTNRSGLDPRPNYPEVDGEPDPREETFNRNNHRFGQSAFLDVSGFFNGEMEVNDQTLYAFGGISKREGESGGFYRRALDARNVPEYYPDGFLPLITSDVYDGSIAVGLKGRLASWNYDLSHNYGHNALNYGVDNSVNASFGVGSPTTFDAGKLAFDQATTNLDFVRTFDIGTADDLSFAWGGEFRYELYRLMKGDAESYADGGNGAAPGAQVFPGFSPSDEQHENRYSGAVYTDLETNIVEPWLVGVAGRFESYSDFGNTLTGKVSTRFELLEELAIRGAASTGFRAPSLSQSYFSSIATVFIDDEPFEVGTFPVTSPAARALGAEDLEAETSVNFSTGATFELGNFSLSADAYHITIDDRVVFTENFTGDDLADYLQSQGVNATGGRFFTNAVDTETQGIDITAQYGVEFTNDAQLRATLGANFNETEITNEDEIQTPEDLEDLTDVPLFGRVEVGRFEVGQPKSNINLKADYSTGPWEMMARVVRYGEIEEIRVDPEDDQVYDNIITTDFELSRTLHNGVQVTLGGNNIFDVYPDKDYQNQSFNGIFPYSSFSPSGFGGRYVYSKVTLNF